MAMKEGSIVYLKSGSPAMTIGAKTATGWSCSWFVGNEIKEHTFTEEQLTETNPSAFHI